MIVHYVYADYLHYQKCYSCEAVVEYVEDPLRQQMRPLFLLLLRWESPIAQHSLDLLAQLPVNISLGFVRAQEVHRWNNSIMGTDHKRL